MRKAEHVAKSYQSTREQCTNREKLHKRARSGGFNERCDIILLCKRQERKRESMVTRKSMGAVKCNERVVKRWKVVKGVEVATNVKHVMRAKCKKSFTTSRRATGMRGNPCKKSWDRQIYEMWKTITSRNKR